MELLHGQLKVLVVRKQNVEIGYVPFRWMFHCPLLLIQIGDLREELVWEKRDPKRERLAVLEVLIKTILASPIV